MKPHTAVVERVLLLLAVIAGCTSVGSPSPSTAAAAPDGSRKPATTAPTGEPVATPHGHELTSSGSGYTNLGEWLDQPWGVAIVRVESVGPIRWDTPTGERPPEELLHQAPPGHEAHPTIGRLVTVKQLRVLRGSWLGVPDDPDAARYWRPGGRLGADTFDVDDVRTVFVPGQRALALLLPEPGDVGTAGSVPVQIAWLFPVRADGRIETLDRSEVITVDDVEAAVTKP